MAHKDYTKAVENPVDLPELVRSYRSHLVVLRRLAQSRPTRNVGATEYAIKCHTHGVHEIEFGLLLVDHKVLLGLLVEEGGLNFRLAEAKRHNIDRPELKMRLSLIRARIRKIARM